MFPSHQWWTSLREKPGPVRSCKRLRAICSNQLVLGPRPVAGPGAQRNVGTTFENCGVNKDYMWIICSLMFTSMDFHMFFCLFVGFVSASVLSNHVPFRWYLSPHPSQSLGKGNSDSLHMFQWNWAEIMAACHCYMYSKFKIYIQNHTNQFDFTDPPWRYICQVHWIDLAWPANIGTHPFAGTLKAAFSCWNMLGSIPSLVWPTNQPGILPSKTSAQGRKLGE